MQVYIVPEYIKALRTILGTVNQEHLNLSHTDPMHYLQRIFEVLSFLSHSVT